MSYSNSFVDYQRARQRTRCGLDVVAAVLALVVYLLTLAPTIAWRLKGADSGDLVSAAYTLVVPHPPGYPLYTLIAAFFAHLPWGEPAQNVGLASALAAAGSVFLLARIMRAVCGADENHWIGHIIPPVGALSFAFTPMFWSQATLAEVYALHIFLVCALLGVLLSSGRHRLILTALVLGIGVAHHLTILLFLPSVFVLLSDSKWDRGQVTRAILLFLVPLLFYLYLPWRAIAAPPVNWGDPRTLTGFWWTVSAEPYRQYFLTLSPADVVMRTAGVANLLFQQYTLVGVGLGLWGLAQMGIVPQAHTRRRFFALLLAFVLLSGYAIVYGSNDSYIYLLPAFVIFVLWMVYGIGDLIRRVSSTWTAGLLAIAFLLVPAYNFAAHFSEIDRSRDREAFDFARNIFGAVPDNALVITDGDEHLFALWYYRYVIAGESSQVSIISPSLLQFDWYYEQMRRTIPIAVTAQAGSVESSYSARLNEIIDRALAEGQPVYATLPGEWLTHSEVERRGDLYWIRTRYQ